MLLRCSAVLLFLAVALAPAAQAQITLIPYGAAGYHYQIGAFDPNVELSSFDDSAYPTGQAPFTSGGTCAAYGGFSGNVVWPANTNVAARLHFNVPGPITNVVLKFAIDNDVEIFINGTSVANVQHEGCAAHDDYPVPLADNLFNPGDNLLVAKAVDRGVDSFFDVTLTAELPTPVARRSWGVLKTIYR